MMCGDLPPSSSVTVFRFDVDIWTTSRPVTYSPVKAILFDVRMLRERRTRRGSESRHDVEDAFGYPRVGGDPRQLHRRHRRVLGGLQHHRVAAGERRRRLPRRHDERAVPRRDAADDAERLAQRVAEVVAGLHRRAGEAVYLRRPAGPVAEHVRRRHDHAGGEERRHADVQRLELRQVLRALLDEIRHAKQEPRALARQHRPPAAVVGGARRDDGVFDVHLVALGDHGLHGAVVREDGLEGLARLRVDELAVDEELIATRGRFGGVGGGGHRRVLLGRSSRSIRRPLARWEAPRGGPVPRIRAS